MRMTPLTSAWLCVALLSVCAVELASADKKLITPESGQDVTLTCRAPSNKTIRAVKWSRADLGDQYVLLYQDGRLDPAKQHPSFKNRVDLQDRQMKDGDVFVILRNVTSADDGSYKCRVLVSESSWEIMGTVNLSVSLPGQTVGLQSDWILIVLSVLLCIFILGFGWYIYRRRRNRVL